MCEYVISNSSGSSYKPLTDLNWGTLTVPYTPMSTFDHIILSWSKKRVSDKKINISYIFF